MKLEQYFYIGTAIVAILSLFGAFVNKKPQIFINYMLNLTTAMVGIYLINTIMKWQEIESGVGINGITIFVGSVLGLPGVLMTYGVSFLG